jgi:hypothetical protein
VWLSIRRSAANSFGVPDIFFPLDFRARRCGQPVVYGLSSPFRAPVSARGRHHRHCDLSTKDDGASGADPQARSEAKPRQIIPSSSAWTNISESAARTVAFEAYHHIDISAVLRVPHLPPAVAAELVRKSGLRQDSKANVKRMLAAHRARLDAFEQAWRAPTNIELLKKD